MNYLDEQRQPVVFGDDAGARAYARSPRAVVDPRIPALVPGFDAPFFQAGLAGYSDAAMRLIAREHGCPYCVTESLLDRTLLAGGKGRSKADLEVLEANVPGGEADHPLCGQVIGTEPEEMAAAAVMLAEMGYDTIDVNLACPVRKIARKCRGGHFLAHPAEAMAVLKAVREAVPASIPTTVKLRRAYDDTAEAAGNFERIFAAAYDLGYSWATVHCRTVEQKYIGPGRWPFLQDLVRRYPDRIIFGSGDIWVVEDIFRMLEYTGVHAVSVARGCIGNPWIFRQARQLMQGQEPTLPTLEEQRSALLRHFELAMAEHGEHVAGRLMRKFGIKFSQHHPDPEAVRRAFIAVHTIDDWKAALAAHYGDADVEAGTSTAVPGGNGRGRGRGFGSADDPAGVAAAASAGGLAQGDADDEGWRGACGTEE